MEEEVVTPHGCHRRACQAAPQVTASSGLSCQAELGTGDRQPRAIRGDAWGRQGRGQGSDCPLASPALTAHAPET